MQPGADDEAFCRHGIADDRDVHVKCFSRRSRGRRGEALYRRATCAGGG
jgi:hypothetical protein